MGGSLAANAAGYISALGYMSPNDIKLITFGQPRIGHADIAARYPSLVPYMYRVTHRLDHVPHTPPLEIGFVHSRNEIWYNNSMLEGDTYIECDAGESMNCSDSVFPNDFAVLEIKTQHYVDKHGNGEHWYFNKTVLV